MTSIAGARRGNDGGQWRHGGAHSTAGFKALMLGSIGVVYGDIGTSPLYALREAVMAASRSPASVDTRWRCSASSR
jgi:K+ transporter